MSLPQDPEVSTIHGKVCRSVHQPGQTDRQTDRQQTHACACTSSTLHSFLTRYHQIECREGKVFFEDLGSTNGSFLNGAPLEERVPQLLSTGDLLKLGATIMTVELQPQPVAPGDSQ